jgi:hypothetical protein
MLVFADASGNLIRLSAGPEQSNVEVEFDPGFPNLLEFAQGSSVNGKWYFKAAGAHITGGTYYAENSDGTVTVGLDVLEKWKPEKLPFAVQILTTVVRVFQNWPPTYQWRGIVTTGVKPSLTGKWERVRR